VRRGILIVVGVFVAANAAIFAAAIVYTLLRPEPANVRAARSVVGAVQTPAVMTFVGDGVDQKAVYRDYLADDDALAGLGGAVEPPRRYILDSDDGFRQLGNWLILASWTGPAPGRDDKRCTVILESTKEVRVESNALSEEHKHAVEERGRTLIRLSALCEE
jgi:hypothetical protein